MTVDDGNGGTATQVITVTVIGTNDAPTISGTATGGIKEDGPDTTVTGQLTQHDIDTNDTHTWSVNDGGKGEYGSFQIDQNGKWTYTLNNDDPKVQALKEGEKVTDTITVTVDDGHGGKATQVITVTITGTNDAAIITPSKPGDDAGSVKEDDKLTTGGKLDVTDKDAGEASFKPQTDFKGDHGKFSLDANGNWKYELDNNDPKVQALGVGEKLTETFEVVTADGTKGKVTVTIDGTNDKPTITGEATGAVQEDGTQTITGQLEKHDVDVNDTHTWSVNDGGKGQYGSLTIDQNGKWTYTLDNDSAKVQALAEGQKVTDTITVTVDDGNGGKTTQTITITITGTNDAAIITPSKPGDDAGSVKEDDKLTTGGKLDVTDKDAGEASFKPQTDFKGDHGKFSIDANGNWKYELDNNDPKVQALGVGEAGRDLRSRHRRRHQGHGHRHHQRHQRRPGHQRPGLRRSHRWRQHQRHRPARQDRRRRQRHPHLVRQQRRQGQVRHLHRRPDRQVDLQPGSRQHVRQGTEDRRVHHRDLHRLRG